MKKKIITLAIVLVAVMAVAVVFVKVKAQAKPKRITLTEQQNTTVMQADAALQDAATKYRTIEAQVNGLVGGIAVSIPDLGGAEWSKKFKLIKADDGKFVFEEKTADELSKEQGK
jgi:hypothetical protein